MCEVLCCVYKFKKSCIKVLSQNAHKRVLIHTHTHTHTCTHVKTMQGCGFVNLLLYHPYLVCTLFGMPSLHLFTFLMVLSLQFKKSCIKVLSQSAHKRVLIHTHTHTHAHAFANEHIYTAQTSGQLRLVRNGFTHGTLTSGHLEVYYSGWWGTVCNDLWDSTNTRVACRELGYLGFNTSWTTSSAGG